MSIEEQIKERAKRYASNMLDDNDTIIMNKTDIEKCFLDISEYILRVYAKMYIGKKK